MKARPSELYENYLYKELGIELGIKKYTRDTSLEILFTQLIGGTLGVLNILKRKFATYPCNFYDPGKHQCHSLEDFLNTNHTNWIASLYVGLALLVGCILISSIAAALLVLWKKQNPDTISTIIYNLIWYMWGGILIYAIDCVFRLTYLLFSFYKWGVNFLVLAWQSIKLFTYKLITKNYNGSAKNP